MKPRKPINKISKKRLEREFGGKMPYTTLGGSSKRFRTTDFDSVNKRSSRLPPAKISRLIVTKFSPDGYRYIASPSDWQIIRHVLGYMAQENCENCGRIAPVRSDSIRMGEADHIKPRGMGGGKRDDRILIVVRDENGIIKEVHKLLQWLCFWCHRAKHNQ